MKFVIAGDGISGPIGGMDSFPDSVIADS